jgi:hypothetical protein
MDVAAANAEYIVLSATEAFSLTAASARRAADFAVNVITECLDHPRPGSRSWSDRAKRLRQSMGLNPGASGPKPVIEVIQTDKGYVVKANPAPADGSD